jgi:hypothetical protein
MQNNQTTTNPLGALGTPTTIIVNGNKLSAARGEVFFKFFEKISPIVKAIRLSRIDGNVTVYVEVFSPDEQRATLQNVFKIDVENYCTRNACMDCKYFDHVHLTKINQNCPLLQLKEKALNDGYAGILYDLILGGD